jgi:glycosyltransferase involved in cell wall biosynthesis
MKNGVPFVSIIIPCRNEKKFIGKCFDSIIANDFPKEYMEVLVIDGMSDDGTRELVRGYSKNYPFIKLLDNPKGVTPVAMNLGLKNACGDYVLILSSHVMIDMNFIRKNVESLNRYTTDCVGGIMMTLSANNNLLAQSIALALSHFFGVGNAYFRVGSKDTRYVDTVPFGCYKRDVFDQIGFFEDNLIRNQDIEFNLRLKRAGGKILLVPDIISYYYARSDFKNLFKQNFDNGFWVIYSLKFTKLPFSLRHIIPFAFVFFLLCIFISSIFSTSFLYISYLIFGVYFIANILFSFQLSLKNGCKYLPFLVSTFFILHFSYGLGSFRGIIKLTASKLKELVVTLKIPKVLFARYKRV